MSLFEEAQPPLSVEREGQFQELTPKLLEEVFTSGDFCGRIRELYEQGKTKRLPWQEQIFHVSKPKDNKVFVSPLMILEPASEFSSFFLRLRNLFKPSKPIYPVLLIAHTHEPWSMSPRLTGKEPMIIPSALDDSGRGDLNVFIQLRQWVGDKSVIRRPIQMIVAQRIRPRYPIELLLVQETEELLRTERSATILQLRKAQYEYFPAARNQQEIIDILQRMGYQACRIALSEERFTARSLFSYEDLEKISQFAY